MLEELLYCSVSVAPHLTDEDLNQILDSARRRNLAEDITGMLIYHQGEFVQILEGRKKSVENIYEKFIDPDLFIPSNKLFSIIYTCKKNNPVVSVINVP